MIGFVAFFAACYLLRLKSNNYYDLKSRFAGVIIFGGHQVKGAYMMKYVINFLVLVFSAAAALLAFEFLFSRDVRSRAGFSGGEAHDAGIEKGAREPHEYNWNSFSVKPRFEEPENVISYRSYRE